MKCSLSVKGAVVLIAVAAAFALSLPLSAENDCSVPCYRRAPGHPPEICIYEPWVDEKSVKAHLALSCPNGSTPTNVRVEMDSGPVTPVRTGGTNTDPTWEVRVAPDWPGALAKAGWLAGSTQGTSTVLREFWARGDCNGPGRSEEARRRFCLVADPSSTESAPQPVIWTDTGPDGIGGGTFQIAAAAFDGPLDEAFGLQVEVGTPLGQRSSLLLGLTWAESSALAAGTGPGSPVSKISIDHLLTDLSYSLDLSTTARTETSVFFGPGWAFTSGVDPRAAGAPSVLDGEGFTAHLGLGIKVDVSDRLYWTVRPRARWFEARDEDELEMEIAIGAGIRFGGRR